MLSSIGPASALMLSATDSGFVTEAGGSSKGDGTIAPPATYNYSTGREEHYGDGFLFSALTPMDRKSYFVFDLTGVSSPIISATLLLYAGPDDTDPFPAGTHGYESLDPLETFNVLETTDPTGALGVIGDLAAGNLVDPSVFDEASDPLIGAAAGLYAGLGDGVVLGSVDITAADDDTVLAIVLSPAGLGYINGFLGGALVLAGALSTAPAPDFPQLVFGFTGPDIPGGDPLTPMLDIMTEPVVDMPEPGSVVIMLSGLIAFCGLRRYRRARRPSAPSNDAMKLQSHRLIGY